MEKHFAKSHFLCPYQDCKSKCYVVFSTESELVSHIDMIHRKSTESSKVVNANALLAFGV